MRIIKLTAPAFGKLQQWESPPIDSNLVVVCGRNEAGKSTLLALITTLLYGWSPANRDHHPYLPWQGGDLSCGGVLVCGGGERLEVHRRLRSRAEGRLASGDQIINLGNNPLPQLHFLSADLFSEVYALTLDCLRLPAGSAWVELEQRLLGGGYPSYLRPVAAVGQELQGEADALWRPDRRGKPLARRLRTRLQELRKLREAAVANEERMRELEQRQLELKQEVQSWLERKTRVTAALNRAGRLLPVRRRYRRIESLEEAGKGGDLDQLLPADPDRESAQLAVEQQELTAEREKLLKKEEALQAELAAYRPVDKALCQNRARIAELGGAATQIAADEEELADLKATVARRRGLLEERARELLTGGWQPELATRLRNLNEGELRSRITSYRRSLERLQREEARLAGLQARTAVGGWPGYTPYLSGGMALVAALLAILLRGTSLSFPCGLLAAIAAGLFLVWSLRGRTDDGEQKEAAGQLANLQSEVKVGRQRVAAALEGIPVVAGLLAEPGESLLVDLARLRNLSLDQEQALSRKNELEHRLGERRQMLRDLLALPELVGLHNEGDCELGRPGESASQIAAGDDSGTAGVTEDGAAMVALIRELQETLNKAVERRHRAEKAGEERRLLQEELTRVEQKLEESAARLAALDNLIAQLPGGDRKEQLTLLAGRRHSRQMADSLRGELEREDPDWQEMLAEIRQAEAKGEDWAGDDDRLAALETERDQIEAELNRVNKEVGTVTADLNSREGERRLDDLDGEAAALEERERQIGRKRDRLVLLANLLAWAERSFRESHQPELLRRAGEYLALITGGRYDRLYLEDEKRPLLMAHTPSRDYPVEVAEELSRGTREQVHLALRLALADLLDQGGETLPLFLDEVLVNWDGKRLERGLALLRQIARRRQLFLFTCHDWLVKRWQPPEAELIELG